MQRHKKLSARILSMALTVAMVATMMPATVFAAEGDVPLGASSLGTSSIGTIQSFEKLEDRFEPSTGEGASKDVYALNVKLNTPVEDLNLPDELTAMVARTTTVSAPAEDEPVVDSGKPSEPATEEVIPDEDKVVEGDPATDGTVSGNQPASPSDAKEEVKEEIKDEDVPLAPEPEQGEETIVTTVEQESIAVTWTSDKEYKSDVNGQFIYTAVLSEGYILADGVELPQIYVSVGKQARTTGGAITVTINGSTTASGATLKAVVESNGGASAVTSLKITAGAVTTADWNYLKNLTKMTTFEIDSAVTVANMPDTEMPALGGSATLFPTTITSVTVPQAITIGDRAFYGCAALTTASFPAATSIGKLAFSGCTALTTASFPAVIGIGDSAFGTCTSLATASFPAMASIGKGAFSICTKLTTASFPAVTSIGSNAFVGCGALTTASFPAVTSIDDYAFSGCAKLATLKLPATPPTVGTEAFTNCPTTRALGYVDANGDDLSGTALTNAQTAYKAVAGTDNNTSDNLWYGWTIKAPTITIGTQPTSPAAMTYGAITGSLTVAGTADNSNPVSYQWYKNTSNSATGGTAVTGATSTSFTIPTTLSAGTHYYYCVLKADGCPDKASDVATVTINKANATDAMKTVAATVSKNGVAGATATLPTKPAAATYGTITYGGTITCSGASVSGDTLTYTAPASTAGDTGTITIPVSTATNYNDYSIVVTITSTDKKAATITAAVADKTYNGVAVTQPTPTAVEKDTTTPVTLTYIYKWQKSNGSGGYTDISGNTAPKDAGSYKLVIEGSSDTHAGTTEITFTISKTTVTITADNKSAHVGDAKPTLTYTAAGLASGDTLATIPTLTYESEPDMSKAGSVKIKASGAVVPNTDNYESTITYVDGTLTISNKSSGGGGGGSSSGGSSTTPPSGGSAGGVITPGKTVIDNPVGNQGSSNALTEAVKNAVAAGTTSATVYTNFANYTALTKDGLKAINDAASAAVKGKNVQLNTKVQLDNKVGNAVVSRITVDPVKLATVMPDKLGLGVWFDQKQDRQVTAVTKLFEKAFDNKIVTVTFEQKSPLAVNMEFAAKPDLSALNIKNLYFYSYDPAKNIYNRVWSPGYWVDKNGYTHFTAPFGGSVIITDKPLSKK